MSAPQISASLTRLKLLEALRSGDTSRTDAIIEELSAVKPTTQTTELIQLRETVLHYAVQIAPLALVQHLAQSKKLDINSQDVDGNTPLHLAASAGRADVVRFLLSLPDINDTITNLKKKVAVELCKDLNLAQLMQFERAKFVEKLATDLRKFFTNRDFDNLEVLLVSNPRASQLLDINGADPETGDTVLHEYIKKEDIQMCDWILKHGGDPFKRDKRGKLPIDLVPSKNEPLRKLLKSASKDQTIMDPVVNTSNAIKAGTAVTYRGYLRKWTNFASGYKLRYFLLDSNGILSYYANQDDTNNACRGSLNLGFATLHLDSSEKLKFEIYGRNGIRWHLKANHPIETNRWVWTLQNAITIAKDNMKRRGVPPIEDDSTSARSSVDDPEKKHRRLHIPGRGNSRKHKRNSSQVSLASATSEESKDVASTSSAFGKEVGKTPTLPNLSRIKEKKPLVVDPEDQQSYVETDVENFDHDEFDDDDDSDGSTYNRGSEELFGAAGDELSTIKRALDIEITSLIDLFSLIDPLQSVEVGAKEEVYGVGLRSIKTIQELTEKYYARLQLKDAKLLKQLDRQLQVNKLWERLIQQLELEIAEREKKLSEFEGKKKKLRKYFSGRSGHASPRVAAGAGAAGAGAAIGAGAVGAKLGSGTLPEDPNEDQGQEDILQKKLDGDDSDEIEGLLRDDSDDEFFDADEFDQEEEHEPASGVGESSGENVAAGEQLQHTQSEKTVVDDSTSADQPQEERAKSKSSNPKHDEWKQILEKDGSFLGYENGFRNKLGMDDDNRPKVSLWGVLKSMIGKDMTKMSLPVSFNEPTSLVQRLAEDIEYATLLDTAASYDDPTLRGVYVAVFGASEYASSINRIAKPFNPLLGETYEYCRPDQSYRLMVEQVSHHPPISACNAESINWTYYGENAVDSLFRGRSFDFKHLGKMFCVVRPINGVVNKNGEKVDEELYSWKKVNTSVVGIITGNPTVDNYGRMEVTNHTTGTSVIIDMKQRGWKASSAYQLSGQLLDSKGNVQWAIGGHWNSKVYAKKVSGHQDTTLDSTTKVSDDPFSGSRFLVWQAAPRPKLPFNLTLFAVTLNGLDERLGEFLPRTDTRLRPDQRAMEEGRYDEAADEKRRVEQKQREARKQREESKKPYRPQWFVKTKHPITGDSYWQFTDEYWSKRKDKKLGDVMDIF